MKFQLPFELGMIASNIFASNVTNVSPSIYILRTSQPATIALSKALDTLGYNRLDLISDTLDQAALSRTYVEVTSDSQLVEISRSHPEAKFILPRGSSASIEEWWEDSLPVGEMGPALSARGLFSEKKRSRGFLELDVLALEAGSQAENWVRLCDFLGMGYSIVERLGLWHFPQ